MADVGPENFRSSFLGSPCHARLGVVLGGQYELRRIMMRSARPICCPGARYGVFSGDDKPQVVLIRMSVSNGKTEKERAQWELQVLVSVDHFFASAMRYVRGRGRGVCDCL